MAATPLAQQTHRNRIPAERRRTFGLYVLAVTVAAAAFALRDLATVPDVLRHATFGFWLMAALALAGDALPVTLPGRWNTSAIYPSICFTFAIMIDYGLAAAVLVQSLAVAVASLRLRHALWRAVFNLGQYALAFGVAYGVLRLLGGVTGDVGLSAAVGAAIAWFTAKYLTTAVALWLRDGGALLPIIMGPLGNEALSTGALLMLGPVIAFLARLHPELVLALILPLLAVRRLSIITAEQRHLANLDTLTGLANRKALMAEVSAAVAGHAQRSVQGDPRSRFGLLLLDVDRFKHVNDALGHEVGDRLLIAVGDRLAEAARDGDLVARLGGDEFALVAKRLTGADEARELAERVEQALSAPVVLDGLPLDVGGSIGIALYPDHGTNFATLMRHAEVAMYAAKNGGDGTAVYSPDTDHNTPQRLSLLGDLRTMLGKPDRGGLRLFYQPQVEISTGDVIGVEALLRWQHPTRGPVSPDELIRVAEPSSVMRLLTRWVVEEAVIQLAKWSASGLHLRMAVNVSVRDLHTGAIVDQIEDLLGRYDVQPEQLQLEITESALMADPHRVLATLTRLQLLGVGIALDDFGTGYSSLQHLRRLPLSEVKIDRSFVLAMADDGDDLVIVRSIIELAGALGLRVVAEGVEDDRAWRLLHAAGCEVGQGWFFARPLPPDELADWLARTTMPAPARLPAPPATRTWSQV
ncbi:putative bifunctional diguanylate cyclase/phosphodiesterase [Catellatospora tritici]|uniref:putative bifunctional diguanylate cyclase/phosphodiesterase n=1 Tax=Catellatospora tritici TaxID=2851566 RepID=UPI001C2CF274|nr:EAL domain-containing protein [Catellatospora tritici]